MVGTLSLPNEDESMCYRAIIFFLTCLSFTFSAQARPPKVTIGLLTDLSGPAAYWGKQTRIGAQIALNELNTGEENALEIVFSDHQLNTAKAVTAAQKLIYIDKVDALYSEFTPTTIAVSPLAKKAHKLFSYAAAAQSILQENPYAFKSYLDYIAGCRSVALHWKRNEIKRVGILKATAEFGELCLEGAKEVYPQITVVDYNHGENVATQVLVLKQKNIQAVLNATFEPDMLRMLKSMKTLKYFPLIGSNEDALGTDAAKGYPRLAKGVILFGFSSINEAFTEKVKGIDPRNNLISLEAAALAYLHVKQLYQVLQSCGSDITCQNDSLANSKADNTIAFQGWKDRVAQFEVAVKGWDGESFKALVAP